MLSWFADYQEGRREPRLAPGQNKFSIYPAQFPKDLFSQLHKNYIICTKYIAF